MSIKIKQLESSLALLQWLEGLGDLGSVIYVKDGKLVITLPIEGTVIEGGGTDISDMATKTWVTDQLAALTEQAPASTVTKEDVADIIKVTPLQTKGSEIATIQVGDSIVTLCCDLSALATIISPAFLGFPTAPEQSSLSDDAAIATTSFVKRVLRLVTGLDVDRAIRDNTAELLDELLRRYNELSGTNPTLETTIEQLLVKIQSSTADPAEIQALILKVQKLMAAQETAEAAPMSSTQQLVLKLRAADPIEGVSFSALEELLLRYAATGSCDNSVNSRVETMLVYDLTKQLCDDLKADLESYLSALTSQRSDTRKDIEDYLDDVQDILAIIQRLLTAYKGLPTSTPAINAAVKDLTDALAAGAAKEELRAKALVLETLLRDYDFSSYGLTDSDRSLEASLRDLEQRLAALYDRVLTAAAGSQYETDYKEFFELLQKYKTSGDVSVEVLLLLEKLAAALEQLGEGSTDPTVPTTIVQTINNLLPLLEQDGFSVTQLLELLLSYRQYNGNDSAVTELLSQLMTFLTAGDTNGGAATDTAAHNLTDRLNSVIADIKALQEELARKQQEELDKKTDTASEDTILKTIKELSAAINNDPKFYETIMSLINGKLSSSGGTVTGDLVVTGNLGVTGAVTGDVTGDLNGTAAKAVSDINGKPVVDYVADVAITGASLMVTKGNGASQPYSLPTSDGSQAVTYNLVTETADGLARKEDHVKLKGIEEGANKYTLPVATDAVTGGVTTGANVTNTNGKISVTKQNVIDALGYTPVNETAAGSYADINTVKEYVKGVSLSGKTLTVTDGNGTTNTFTTQDTTYTIFTGANSSTAGKTGIIPAPSKGYQNRYLKGDGTWSKISASDIDGLSSYTPSGGGDGGGNTTTDLSDYLKKDIADNTYAPINSPVLTGTPKSVTPSSTDNSTAIATTAFVQTLLANKQPMHASLTSIAGLTTAADKMIYTTAANKYAVTGITAAAREFLGQTSKANMLTYLGAAGASTTAATATKLANARTVQTNLASTTAASFDGSSNITPGVTGTLKVANGGTGLTAAPSMLTNLASTTAAGIFAANPRPGVTGTLPVANGGTGKTSLANVTGVGNAVTADKLSTARTISLTGGVTGSVSFDGSKNVSISTSVSAAEKSPAFANCTTAAGTVAKTVTISDFTLVEGVKITVNFTNGNTAKNPTLNVSGTGAKAITYAPGVTPESSTFTADSTGINSFPTNRTVEFTYTSGQWVVSRSNIWATSWISGILSNRHWGAFVTTCYAQALVGAGNIYYGLCTTAQGTAAKAVTCPEMTSSPTNGTTIIVHMRNGNSAASPTFNVNSKGAFAGYGPSEVIKKIPPQSNVWLVYCDTSTSSASSGRWHIGKISFGYIAEGDIFTVSTAAGTAAKVNTVELARERNYVHTHGGSITVNFTVANTAANPTLNINGFGAKAMYWPDGTRITKGDLTKGIWHFIYKSEGDAAGYYATREKAVAATAIDSVETASKLATARTIQTNLGSTTAVSFNGTANIQPGVTGTLKVANGGTGATSLANITVGNATTAEKLKTARTITLSGAVTGSASFNGSANITITTTASSAATTAPLYTGEGTNVSVDMAKAQLRGGTDYARVRFYETASDGGTLEIATADNGIEPIIVRQYGSTSTTYDGAWKTVKNEAVLLDGSGNTKFPGTVTAKSFSGAISGTFSGTFSGTVNGAAVPGNTSAGAGDNMKKGCLNFGSPYGSLKLQWGTANFSNSNRYVDFTFPTAFTTACYSVMVCSGDNGTGTTTNNTMNYTILAGSITKTKVRIARATATANATYSSDWICIWAIGV